MAKIVVGGEYEHFKGKRYRVIGVAKHSETMEELVIYQKLYDDHGLWVRPIGMFTEEVKRDGKRMPRFRYLEPIPKIVKRKNK